MIAAKRRRTGKPVSGLGRRLVRWTRRVDRGADRALQRAHPALLIARHRARRGSKLVWARTAPILLPPVVLFFRALGLGDLAGRRVCSGAYRTASAASRVLSPRRAIGLVIVAAGVCLIVAQFIDYRGVEIGLPGYKGLADLAKPPAVDVKVAGEAHSYLLVAPGALAIALGLFCGWRESGRAALAVLVLGLGSLAVILLVDMPAGLDVGAESSRFAGASAVLKEGFYAELAAAGAMVVAGLAAR